MINIFPFIIKIYVAKLMYRACFCKLKSILFLGISLFLIYQTAFLQINLWLIYTVQLSIYVQTASVKRL